MFANASDVGRYRYIASQSSQMLLPESANFPAGHIEQLDWSCLAKAYHADKRTQTIITALEDPLSAEHYRHKYHYDTDTQKLMLTGSFGADARVVVPICDDTVKLRRQLIALHHDLPCMGHYSHAGTYKATRLNQQRSRCQAHQLILVRTVQATGGAATHDVCTPPTSKRGRRKSQL